MDECGSISSWYNVEHVPGSYIFPDEARPGKLFPPLRDSIPVIDLGKLMATDPKQEILTVHHILNAAQEFGVFQVINHGVSETVMRDTMGVCKEFFNMVTEDKATGDHSLYCSSTDFAKDGVHFWRENLKHYCYPLDRYIHSWPEKPPLYRTVVGKYSTEVRRMTLKILELISKGLKLEPGYLGDELGRGQYLSVNHYPPCPDPTLTLGLPRHCDPSLITVLYQGDVHGLQIRKDDQWIGVDPIPNAFVVNIGYQLQVVSNGKLKAAEHRAVTNSEHPRTSIVTFFHPCFGSIIEPAKTLVNRQNPQLYRAFQFQEFLDRYVDKDGDPAKVLQDYKLKERNRKELHTVTHNVKRGKNTNRN